MTETTQSSKDASQSAGKLIRTQWLNPRLIRFWLIVLVLLYTLLGFFAAPALIRNNVTALLQDDLGRVTHIEKIEVNPFALSLRVQGFELDDTDGVRLAAFDELYVNFQFLSLLKWAWTFSEIQLTSPYFFFERFDSGNSRIDLLLADFAANQAVAAVDTDDSDPNGVPRLLIRNLGIINGKMDTRDNVPPSPVELQLSSINIAIQELNTIPNHLGQQAVTIRLPGDAVLKWNGSLNLAPLDSSGAFALEGLQLDPLIAYLESLMPLESISATLSTHFQYHLRQDDTGDIKLDIDGLDVSLDDLLVHGLTPATDFVDIKKIALQDGKLRYPEQSLYFGKLNIQDPQLTAWVNEDGRLSVMDLVPATDEQQQVSDTDGTGSSWQLGIGEFELENGDLTLTDRSIQPAAAVDLTDLRARFSGISNEDGIFFPFEINGGLAQGGSYTLDGSMGVLPGFSMSGTARTDGIPLSLGQAYIQQFAHIEVKNGVLDTAVEVNLPAGRDIAITGSIKVPGLEINSTLSNEKLLSWELLDIDRFDLDKERLAFSQLAFKQPFGRFVVHEDMTTNLAALVIEQASEPGADEKADPLGISIGGISVDDGSMDFADFSLPLPFSTYVAKLDGTISTIDTNSSEPANIRMEGQVDEYGLARIEGSMNVLDPIRHTDITVEFRNLPMNDLSPYTAAFAGRRIEQGKLDLGLVYSIDEGQLHGANDVVLSDLVLGEKVDHPDAANLPLGLAVSLLKDSDGVIRIDLPVEGNINDPEFRIGGVVWKAFAGLITKIVAAPFKLLANLIGVDSEDFGQFEFLAGRADLTPPELEKVVQLQEALQKRPELTVEINGVSDPGIDIPALKFIRLRGIANERLDEGLGDHQDETMMLDEEIRNVVLALFIERFPDIPPESLQAAHTAPSADNPEGKPVLDELAWAVDMWNRLLGAEVISGQDLADLAMARAQAIQAAFLANDQVDEGRIVIAETKEVESEDGEWVKLELAVVSK